VAAAAVANAKQSLYRWAGEEEYYGPILPS